MGARLDVAYLGVTIGVPEVDISGKPLWDAESADVSGLSLRYSHGFPGLTYYGALSFGSAAADPKDKAP